jgi:DnaK suppressor protein
VNVCAVPPLAQHELQAALERQRTRIRRSIASLGQAVRSLGESQSEEGTAGDQADLASDVELQASDLALEYAERERLSAVEAALERIDLGSYGICSGCGRPIAVERLYAQPWTEHCLDCARRVVLTG